MGTFDAATFVTTYLPIPIFFILLIGFKLVKKTKIVSYHDMDFVTGCSADMPIDVSDDYHPADYRSVFSLTQKLSDDSKECVEETSR